MVECHYVCYNFNFGPVDVPNSCKTLGDFTFSVCARKYNDIFATNIATIILSFVFVPYISWS